MVFSKRSILYLDDEAICLDVFHKMFSEEYDVRIALTSGEARRALLERPSDIIISDQTMPGLNGKDFLCEVATAYPLSVRMLLTGSICVSEALQEIGTGIVNIFISKPWTKAGMSKVLLRASLFTQHA
jgi:DNA-binding NtrC family response regulator